MTTELGGHVPGLCAEHGGLMWSNAMRACITPDDVIRGGCRWQPFPGPLKPGDIAQMNDGRTLNG